MTEPVQLPTRREWLANKGLAESLEQAKRAGKRGGGRLSRAAHEAVKTELVTAGGQRFSDAKAEDYGLTDPGDGTFTPPTAPAAQ